MRAGDLNLNRAWQQLWVVFAVVVTLIVFLVWPDGCPMEVGDRVYSHRFLQSGTVVRIADRGSAVDSCYVAVRFDDGGYSQMIPDGWIVDGDPRYVPNWELEKIDRSGQR